MAKIRGLIINPIDHSVRETMVTSTPGACSRVVGGFMRFGAWIGKHDALYLSGDPETGDAFMIADRIVIGVGLILGAGSGRRGLKTPATVSLGEIEAAARFSGFPDCEETLNAAVARRHFDWLEERHPSSFRKPR